MTSIPNVKKIIERKSKQFLVELDSSKQQWVSINILNKHFKPLLEQFTNKNIAKKRIKLNELSKVEKPLPVQPIFNLDNEIKEQHLIEEENFKKYNSQIENNSMVVDSHENDIPEKFLFQKTTRKKEFKIELKNSKGVEMKKVSFDYLKQNYPIKLLNFIQKNIFNEGIVIKATGDTMNLLNKLLTDKI